VLVEGSLVSSTYEQANGKGKKAKTAKITSWSIRADVVRKLDRGEPEPQAPASGSDAAVLSSDTSDQAPFRHFTSKGPPTSSEALFCASGIAAGKRKISRCALFPGIWTPWFCVLFFQSAGPHEAVGFVPAGGSTSYDTRNVARAIDKHASQLRQRRAS